MIEYEAISSIISFAEVRIKEKTGLDYKLVKAPAALQDQFIYAFAMEWGVSPSYIYGQSQMQDCVTMRQVLMLRMTHAGLSYGAIASALGYADHTTIVKAVPKAEAMLQNGDAVLVKYYNQVKHLFDEESKS